MKTHPKIKEMAEKYGKPEEEFYLRADGRVEWICKHGVGHTVYGYSIHGCDGCCDKLGGEDE